PDRTAKRPNTPNKTRAAIILPPQAAACLSLRQRQWPTAYGRRRPDRTAKTNTLLKSMNSGILVFILPARQIP
ncbi:MAG: hypothetical protein KDD10_25250, partial [Phaeodactylibacter sp.]|nr:hypothetical protein [Phaeodactylibacter sp.]